MARGMVFSERELRALEPRAVDYKVGEKAPRGEGRLIIRVRSSGLKEFYYRMRADNTDQLIRIGRFEQTPGDGGLTLKQARTKLNALVTLQQDTGNAKAELERQKEVEAQARVEADRAARIGTFGQMLDAYVGDLRARNKITVDAVDNNFTSNVKKPFPDLCRGLANKITSGDIQAILAKLYKRGVRRGVNHLRAYLHAAFQFAAKNDNDPTRLAVDGAIFQISSNPVALVPRKAEFENVGERNLTPEELHRFWHKLDTVLPVAAHCLRFNLALGGQRGIQLIRALWKAYDFEFNTVLLRDPKGRSARAREHLLPMTEFGLEMLAPLRELNRDETGPFSSRFGKSLHTSTLSNVVTEIWEALAAEDVARGAPEIIEKFTFKDIRRTCETLLGSIGISLDLRAHILSHGLTGVQNKHYDRWKYIDEKRAALTSWAHYMRRIIKGTWTDGRFSLAPPILVTVPSLASVPSATEVEAAKAA